MLTKTKLKIAEAPSQLDGEIIKEAEPYIKPLQEHFGIKLHSYRKIFHDRRVFFLPFDEKLLRCADVTKPWITSQTFKRLYLTPKNQTRLFIWEEAAQIGDPVYDLLYNLGIRNGLSLNKGMNNGTETWGFNGVYDRAQAEDIYLNHSYILDRFISYFREKAAHVLKPDDSRMTCIQGLDISKQQEQQEVFKTKLGKYIKDTPIRHYFLETDHSIVWLTKREAQCLFYSAQGMNRKEIGKTLGVSSRTVETYLQQIYQKMEINNKNVLIRDFKAQINQWAIHIPL